jgi:hypothetical protein
MNGHRVDLMRLRAKAWVLAAASALVCAALKGNPVPFADQFSLRGSISGFSGSGDGSNVGTSVETGEPVHGGLPVGRTVWVSWVAPADGVARIITDGSKFDTVLAVYADEVALRGGNPANPPPNGPFARLREVAVQDDADAQDALFSRVEFPAQAGVRYEIAVAGYAGAAGEVQLAWELMETGRVLPVVLNRERDRVVSAGSPATLAFEVLTSAPLTYQWFLNGQPLPGATASTLAIPSPGPSSVGRYALRITEPGPEPDDDDDVVLWTRTVELQLGAGSTLARDKIFGWSEAGFTGTGGLDSSRNLKTLGGGITPPPAGPTRGYSGSHVFDTTAARRDPGEPVHCGVPGGFSYWYRYTPATAGELWFDTYGSGFDTVLAIYTFNPPLNGYPGLIPVTCNDDEPFADGRSRVTFAAEAGRTYIVVVDGKNGGFGRVNLSWALGPLPPPAPVLTRAPAPVTVVLGQPATFQVDVTGQSLLYQWRRGGVVLPGATNRVLALPAVTRADDGLYDVVVTNAGGRVTAPAARLTVVLLPGIERQPGAQIVAAGGVLRLELVASGTGPLNYQWRLNGAQIPGATASTLVRSAFSTAMAGRYDCVVSSAWGSITSIVAVVSQATALQTPTVATQPAPVVVPPGGAIRLSVGATGGLPLRYQWHRNGAPLSGATGFMLTIPNATITNSGSYHVVVANAAGQISSAAVRVSVVSAPRPRAVLLAEGPAVSVETVAGLTYSLEARTQPLAGAWTPVASQTGTGGVITFRSVATESHRHFRVVVR